MQNDRVPYTRPGGKKPRPAAPRTPAPAPSDDDDLDIPPFLKRRR